MDLKYIHSLVREVCESNEETKRRRRSLVRGMETLLTERGGGGAELRWRGEPAGDLLEEGPCVRYEADGGDMRDGVVRRIFRDGGENDGVFFVRGLDVTDGKGGEEFCVPLYRVEDPEDLVEML